MMKIVRDPKPEERFVISHRPLNADDSYPRLNVIGLGMNELSLGREGETVLRGHVDRLADGSILWTNVSSSRSFFGGIPNKLCLISSLPQTWETGCTFLHLQTQSRFSGVANVRRFAGFQLGGFCSASGVVGTWTTSAHNVGAFRYLSLSGPMHD